ncbi:transposase [Mycolicibacterium grossiae]|uniref:Transposase n=1 Tax=Mycolicibacterium grossiae TaxID=1552759 RepID=A0A1E8Q911_9MYCO|nr:transposase [Mycolicibacterium grossiae]OFJ55113.1 transposase [Mycolicibacterium grossiae]QEM47892.1 transposase [Mycolicibacterium grossiae]
MSLHDDLENFATAAVSDWPKISLSGQLDVAIRDLYRAHLPFPQFWTPEEREEYVEEWASFDSQRLVTQFDDASDVVIDRFCRQNGYMPHQEDAAEMINKARKAAVYDLECCIAYLAEDLAQKAIHTAGRTVSSMTGCSPAARRSRRTRGRGRRRIR